MNRNILIAFVFVWLSLAAGLKAATAETNAGADVDWNSFQAIAQKNIFDPTRAGGRSRTGSVKKAAVVRTFTFRGSDGYVAFFTGEGTPRKGYVRAGDSINGFKVMKIALDYVKLAEPNGNLLKLMTDDTMRREEDGPWAKSDQPAPVPVTVSETKSDGSAPSGPPGESDILKKLRLKREQEQK